MVYPAVLLTALLSAQAVLASDKSKSTTESNTCSPSTVTQTVTSTVTVYAASTSSIKQTTSSGSLPSSSSKKEDKKLTSTSSSVNTAKALDSNKSKSSTSTVSSVATTLKVASSTSTSRLADNKSKSSSSTTSSTLITSAITSADASNKPSASTSISGLTTSKVDDRKSSGSSNVSSISTVALSSKIENKTKTSTSASASISPSGSTASAVQAKSTVSLSTSFIYDLDNQPIDAPVIRTATGLSLSKTMYVVDMAQSTAEQIANYHAKGKTVGCYFSAGTWEPYRTDAKQFLPECYCGPNVTIDSTGRCTGSGSDANLLGEWGEWWLNIRSEKCLNNIKSIMTDRIKAGKQKGCDSVDPDNVDAWTNHQNFGITQQDQVNYLLWLSSTARSNGLGIDLKNSGDLITDPDTGTSTNWTTSLINAFDFNVIESCYQYNECEKYDPFLEAGKPQIRIEYESSIKRCPSLKQGQQLLVYSDTVVNSTQITLSCP
ncbi:hypothetical protein L486_08529 [Kwoniella mangroviensis CBS 10435]|uniref:alpha-galactosidase n=2 Tax=Kwoniella mangrovensis TaxID=463800 RepID=A0A1B9IEI7_9TREE|nr:hypothetical protein L486_08529 [Kwoniella mangroviensis CBS 10435]